MLAQKEMLPHYTYDDYVLWEGNWELINGLPYAMSPAPVPNHQRIANNLGGEFYQQLKNRDYCTAYQPLDYKVAEDTVLQPDLLVICGKVEKKFLDFTPDLVVEILSPSTVMKDRHIKFPIYERQGVKYLVLISTEREMVEIYELKDGEYELLLKEKDMNYDFSFNDYTVKIDFSQIW